MRGCGLGTLCVDVVWVHCAWMWFGYIVCGCGVSTLCVDVCGYIVCGCGVDTLWCGSPYLSIIIMFIMCSCTGFMETVT